VSGQKVGEYFTGALADGLFSIGHEDEVTRVRRRTQGRRCLS
jgi:hypothetical protein